MKLYTFFNYFGAKWRIAPKYPEPKFKTIIEPFAGAAGYSLNYSQHDIVLIERDERQAAMWKWLIKASKSDIVHLPLLHEGEDVANLSICEEARIFIGFNVGSGMARPQRKLTPFSGKGNSWSKERRERIANQVQYIKHWRVIQGDYTAAPDTEATWFIDPPYIKAGKSYSYGSHLLDFEMLGRWCRRRQGQVMVCENEGATWLPFKFLTEIYGARRDNGKARKSSEVLWYRFR